VRCGGERGHRGGGPAGSRSGPERRGCWPVLRRARCRVWFSRPRSRPMAGG
jgi:hypothetical protein